MGEVVDFWTLFDPLPRQVRFLQLTRDHRYLLYGGARGGGKSKLLRWGPLWQLLEWAKAGHKHVRVGLFSEDYPTLRDRQIGKIKVEFPDYLGTLKATQDEGLGFYLHEEYGGGAILLRNLDDPAKYQSAEFALVAVEELTKNRIDTFNILRGSLRWPGIEHTQFWGATNPGGIGHLWVKQAWIDQDFSGELDALAPRAAEFAFVRSLPADNPHLPQSYWDELNSLPEGLRRAWVEGNWDVYEGQAFPEWNSAVHVTEYEPERQPYSPGAWWGCGDWGYTNQGVLYQCWSGPERSLVRHEYAYKKTDPYTVGFNFGKQILRFPRPDWIAIDTPAVSDGGPTILEELQRGMNDAGGQHAPVFINPPKGPGSRATKKQLLHEALRYTKPKDGRKVQPWEMPKLQVHSSCKYLIRTLPALPLDPNNSEDVDSDADDHGYDGITAGLMARTPQVDRDRTESRDPDAHPGLTKSGERRRPTVTVLVEGPPQHHVWTRPGER